MRRGGSLGLGISWLRFFGGLMGGGKSYYAVQQIAHILSLGGTVHTNIEILRPGMRALILHRYGVDVGEDIPGLHLWSNGEDAAKIARFWNHIPAGAEDVRNLVVIDEAHDYFPAGRGKFSIVAPLSSRRLVPDVLNPDGTPVYILADEIVDRIKHSEEAVKWLKKCRHQFTEVILISQTPNDVAAAIRRICNYWSFKDLGKLTILGFKLPSRLVAIEREEDRSGQGKGQKIQSFNQKKDPRVFAAYKSTQYTASVAVAERQAVTRVSSGFRIKKRWLVAAGIVGAWWWHSSKPGLTGASTSAGNTKSATAAGKVPATGAPVPVQRFAIVNRAGFDYRGNYVLAFDNWPPNEFNEVVSVGEWSNNLQAVILAVAGNRLVLSTPNGKENATIATRPFRGSYSGNDTGSKGRRGRCRAPLSLAGDTEDNELTE